MGTNIYTLKYAVYVRAASDCRLEGIEQLTGFRYIKSLIKTGDVATNITTHNR